MSLCVQELYHPLDFLSILAAIPVCRNKTGHGRNISTKSFCFHVHSTKSSSTTFATQQTSTTKSVNSNNDMQRPCHTCQACFRISGKSRSKCLIAHQRLTMERRSANSIELSLGFELHLSALIHLRTWCVPHGVPHRVRKANNGGRLLSQHESMVKLSYRASLVRTCRSREMGRSLFRHSQEEHIVRPPRMWRSEWRPKLIARSTCHVGRTVLH